MLVIRHTAAPGTTILGIAVRLPGRPPGGCYQVFWCDGIEVRVPTLRDAYASIIRHLGGFCLDCGPID